jgi:hypothetical protein
MAVRLRTGLLPLLMMTLSSVASITAVQSVTWGGEHVHMEVSKSGATLDFDCAHGAITQALPQKGKFSLKGTFTPERGGPTRDDAPPTVDATYSGTIADDSMTLRIVLAGSDKGQTPIEYALKKGERGNVRKCR